MLSHEAGARLFARALQGGARRLSFATVEWDISGGCQTPVVTEHHTRPSVSPRDLVRWRPVGFTVGGTSYRKPTRRAQARQIVIDGKGKSSLTVIMWTKCRRCATCLRKRAAHWRLRAMAETKYSSRTWFGTLTLAPERQFQALSEARLHATKFPFRDFDAMPEAERFAEVVKRIGLEVTRYLKRVREQSGARFRYLLVAERHESGNPHFHMLVHEWGAPLRERVLSGQWTWGFSKWRLVPPDNPRAASYVCKYLSKSPEARVRASGFYGRGPRAIRPVGQSNTTPKEGGHSVLRDTSPITDPVSDDRVITVFREKVKELWDIQ